jgi:branched-chain amino acid aminotransferase
LLHVNDFAIFFSEKRLKNIGLRRIFAMTFPVQHTHHSRLKETDFSKLPFGQIFSDHMFSAICSHQQWQDAGIVPYGNFEVSPALTVFHHGQAIFEGMKAFKNPQGEVFLFRVEDNFKRMNESAIRMCMPEIPREIFINGLKQLIDLDREWIPVTDGYSLYIRPVYFSADTVIGVKPADTYRFFIVTCPSGAYYSEPLKVWVETRFSRSAEGGTGYAKAAGNYAGAMYPTRLAGERGYHQLIWTDAKENRWIEESGSMNVMFVVDGALWTPSLSHSKLAGVTRDSILTLAREWGMKVEERNIAIEEIVAAYQSGKLQEAFGVGTAANIAPIITIGHEDLVMDLPAVESRDFSKQMRAHLMGIKKGEIADTHGWITKL